MTPKNIYLDPLESFSFDEMVSYLQASTQETARIDFKERMIEKSKLAHISCSFANAEGGIIAIGFTEPTPERPANLSDPVDISDSSQVALIGTINARTYSPLPLAIHGYYGNNSERFLVLRIARSLIAPHEYIHSDIANNLPVRRGAYTSSLRLAEIDALRTRQGQLSAASPLGTKPFTAVSFIPENINPSCFFGMRITPTIYSSERRILDQKDDEFLSDAGLRSKGVHGNLHTPLTLSEKIDGILLSSGPLDQKWADNTPKKPSEQIQIDSDGEITIRFIQNDESLLLQWYALLATGYSLTQNIFYQFKIYPAAHVEVVLRIDARREREEPIFPPFFNDHSIISLANQEFADAFTPTTMLLYRASKRSMIRERVHQELNDWAHGNIFPNSHQWLD